MNTRALTRPTGPRKLRITLTADHAAQAARNEVRAAIRAWDVPVDPSVAVLLTSELVANALRHEAGRAIELVVSCALGQLQVDVYDTSPATALQVDAPADSRTGAGLMLLASLSTTWGYCRTPPGGGRIFHADVLKPHRRSFAGGTFHPYGSERRRRGGPLLGKQAVLHGEQRGGGAVRRIDL